MTLSPVMPVSPQDYIVIIIIIIRMSCCYYTKGNWANTEKAGVSGNQTVDRVKPDRWIQKSLLSAAASDRLYLDDHRNKTMTTYVDTSGRIDVWASWGWNSDSKGLEGVCVLCTLCSRDLLCTAVQETSVLDFHVGQSLNPTPHPPPPPPHTHNLSEAIIQINAHMRFKVILKIGKKMIWKLK